MTTKNTKTKDDKSLFIMAKHGDDLDRSISDGSSCYDNLSALKFEWETENMSEAIVYEIKLVKKYKVSQSISLTEIK